MGNPFGKTSKSRLIFCGCAAAMLFAAACGQSAPPDTRGADANALRDLDAAWSKTASANDVDGTVSYYTDDASLLPPNAPAATGKPAIRSAWAALLVPGNAVSWQADKVEVARSSDLAYTVGTYQATIKDPQGKTLADRGKYTEVWKKQTDGKWKVVADMYNSDLPMTPAPEKKVKAKARAHKRAARRKKRA
jgi:uncharacterized protein (TIGR02246 family)